MKLKPQHTKYFFILLILTVLCKISPAQTPPVANPDTAGVCTTSAVYINVLANDTDIDVGDSIHLQEIIVDAENGTVFFSPGGIINYTPDVEFTGTDVLLYRVQDSEGLSSVGSLTIYVQNIDEAVWPGDANNDGITNNIDVLNIGLYYGNTGPHRYDLSNLWQATYSAEWSPELLITPVNPKYADCNGDGIINKDDTLPVITNYSEVHAKTLTEEGGSDFPPLALQFFNDSIAAGSYVSIPVILGSIDNPAQNIYGMAFTLSYNSELIVPGSLKVTFNDGWLGSADTSLFSINKDDTLSGLMDVAVSRINHTSVSGWSNIGEVSFVMEDNLAGKTTGITAVLTLCPQNPILINDFGEVTDASSLNLVCDSVVIYSLETSIIPSPENLLKIYPNPADDNVNILLPQNFSGTIQIINMLGDKLFSIYNYQQASISINTNNFPIGTYFIKTEAAGFNQIQKLIIQH